MGYTANFQSEFRKTGRDFSGPVEEFEQLIVINVDDK